MKESLITIKNSTYYKLFGPEEELKVFAPPVLDTFERVIDIHAVIHVLKSLPTEKVVEVLFELPIELVELYLINIDIDKDF